MYRARGALDLNFCKFSLDFSKTGEIWGRAVLSPTVLAGDAAQLLAHNLDELDDTRLVLASR